MKITTGDLQRFLDAAGGMKTTAGCFASTSEAPPRGRTRRGRPMSPALSNTAEWTKLEAARKSTSRRCARNRSSRYGSASKVRRRLSVSRSGCCC